jgi:WD40 repeat protein
VNGLAFSADGTTPATAAADQTIRLWDVATRTAIGKPLASHASVVRDVAFSPDGKLLASAEDDKTVPPLECWHLKARRDFGGPHRRSPQLAFTPDGRELTSERFDPGLDVLVGNGL